MHKAIGKDVQFSGVYKEKSDADSYNKFCFSVPFDQLVITFRVETGSGHLGHILSKSTRSDPLYKISALNHLLMASGADQSDGY